jgi:N-acetyl-alpha-D-muramate 1-phosphate uridylyltransferase
MQAVILAGGLGTRLRPMTETVPKAMVPISGRPFLEYQLELLREGGIQDFVICIGHLGDQIQHHFGDGQDLGVKISYSRDGPRLLGPAGALKRAERLLDGTFFVTYGDAYLRAPYRSVMGRLRASKNLAVMTTYRNDNRHGTSDLLVSRGYVVGYDKKGGKRLRWINFGVTALRKDALALIPPGSYFGEEEFYGALIAKKELLAYPVTKRFYEIGGPNSLADFVRFISQRK